VLNVLFFTSYCVEVENCALLAMSCGHGKWSLEVVEKSWIIFSEKCGKPVCWISGSDATDGFIDVLSLLPVFLLVENVTF